MYVLKHGIKKNPEKFWALPDRIFFGYGACHILAGTFLGHPPKGDFTASGSFRAKAFRETTSM
ncbi:MULTISPECIES: hypothetical protein [unclassified Mesorhizobium]|uniref:hypothetical protein n=1 Tax=unclassified Mesorhizobium TaxID=325217 RepID=UPI001FDEAF2B|nr:MULTISPECIES: hypothetical protein [unclassified Mesorhizobium]